MNRSGLVIVIATLAIASTAIAAEQKADEPKKSAGGETATHVMLTPADLEWGDAPPGLPTGAKIAKLEGDPAKKGFFTVRLQFPAGYKIAPHTHPTAEKVTIISGTGLFGMGPKFEAAAKEMDAGSFVIMPAGMQHFALAKTDTVVQISGKGPFEIKYVNPADDPRQAKQ